jgi:uncharacterized protein YjbI with pentapeptide repeats
MSKHPYLDHDVYTKILAALSDPSANFEQLLDILALDPRVDLRHQNLSGIDTGDFYLTQADVEGADLTGAIGRLPSQAEAGSMEDTSSDSMPSPEISDSRTFRFQQTLLEEVDRGRLSAITLSGDGTKLAIASEETGLWIKFIDNEPRPLERLIDSGFTVGKQTRSFTVGLAFVETTNQIVSVSNLGAYSSFNLDTLKLEAIRHSGVRLQSADIDPVLGNHVNITEAGTVFSSFPTRPAYQVSHELQMKEHRADALYPRNIVSRARGGNREQNKTAWRSENETIPTTQRQIEHSAANGTPIAATTRGGTVAVAADSGVIEISDNGRLWMTIHSTDGYREPLIAMSNSGSVLIVQWKKTRVYFKSGPSGQWNTYYDVPIPTSVSKLAISDDGQWIAGVWGEDAHCWRVLSWDEQANNATIEEQSLSAMDDRVLNICISASGDRIVYSTLYGDVFVFDRDGTASSKGQT